MPTNRDKSSIKPNKRAQHIRLFYGHQALVQLVEDFKADTPMVEIAKRMQVTRACVSQWKAVMGAHSQWRPFDDVAILLEKDGTK